VQDAAIDPSDPQKGAKVREMFAGIAGKYDLLNRVLSGGRDQAWRRLAVRMAELKDGESVLDCCCGTGDLTLLFAGAEPVPARVVGADFTPEMLRIAKQKTAALAGAMKLPTYSAADGLRLPFGNASFDVVSVAFGVRNFQDVNAGMKDLVRVLKPGGRLVILEFTPVKNFFWRALTSFHMNVMVPLIGQIVSRSRHAAYKYLPKSIGVHYRKLNLRTVAIHAGTKATQNSELRIQNSTAAQP
jgi:demethylmenaquinone methyltransferase/2-methoxy-6-polyprenyl-1,4-benzoquinol methylase